MLWFMDEWKAVETFSKDSNTKCGYGTWCKDCRKEYNSQNLERDRIRNKKYREENPEIVTAFRTNYKNIKKEKDKASSKRISDENSLLSLNDLYLKTPTKYCHSCKVVKQTVEFSRRNCVKDGFYSYCRTCKREKDNEEYYKNRQK